MTETQELVVLPSNTQVATYVNTNDESGLADIRLKPTELVLVQNTTQNPMGASPGEFLDAAFGESFKELTVVPLKYWSQKVLFPPGSFQKGVQPICKSNDGKVPSPYVETPQSSSCLSCPKNIWKKIGGKSIRPDCGDKLRFLLITKETELPKMMTVTGKSITAANIALQAIKQYQQIAFKKEGVLPNLHDFFFTLKSDRVSSSYGVSYVVRFDSIKRVANLSQFGPIFEEYVTKYKQGLIDTDEDGAPASAPTGDGIVHEAEIVSEV